MAGLEARTFDDFGADLKANHPPFFVRVPSYGRLFDFHHGIPPEDWSHPIFSARIMVRSAVRFKPQRSSAIRFGDQYPTAVLLSVPSRSRSAARCHAPLPPR